MKRSDIFYYVFLTVILWVNLSVALDICQYRNELQILSIFNFEDDLIIQTNDTNSGLIGLRRIRQLAYYFDKYVRNSEELEELAFEENFIPSQNDTGKTIDKNQRIFGYVTPINSSWGKQGQGHSVLYGSEFDEFKSVIENEYMSFVCIHGMKVNTTNVFVIKVFKYDSQQPSLKLLSNPTLEVLLRKSCMPTLVWNPYSGFVKFYRPKMISFINWREIDTNELYYNNITLMTYDAELGKPTKIVKVMASVRSNSSGDIYDTWLRDDMSELDFYHIFRFSHYYKFMVCPQFCTLDQMLYFVHFNQDRIQSDSNFTHSYSRITIRQLLGCSSDITITPFDPNLFCDERRTFLSLFSLSEDLYFQRSGRFWGYHNNRFTEESNPLLNSGNKYQIRLESDFTALIERNEFDTSRPVIGFTFEAPVFDSCGSDDKVCNEKHMQSGDYFRVCLFGNITNTQSHEEGITFMPHNHWQALYYTPNGLTQFQRQDLFDETYDFCGGMLFNIPDVNAITSGTDKESADNFVVSVVGNREYVVTFTWAKDTVKFDLKLMKRRWYRKEGNPKFLFTFQDKFVIEHHNDKLNLLAFGFNKSTITGLFNCPFKESTSLVTLKRETICQKNKISSIQSVFTVGSFLYHQIGQHFYRYDLDNDKGFVYDRGASDLLNDYFDTTDRLTGYSRHRRKTSSYVVVIYGRTAFNFKLLGEYIFAVFTINQTYGSSVLKPKKNWTNSYKITMGNLVPTIVDIEPIDIMGLMPTKGPGDFLIWIQESRRYGGFRAASFQVQSSMLLPPSLAWVKQGTELTAIKWTPLSSFPKERILGLYRHNNVLNLVAYSRKKPEKVNIYDPGSSRFPNGTAYGLIGNMTDFKEIGDYHLTYCKTSGESGHKSDSSSGPKTLSTIMAVLLLILLILALLSGFFLYYMNQRKESIHSIEKPDPRVDSFEPNRPNYTVVRHPEPNFDTSVSNEVQSSSKDNKSGERSVRSERI